MNHIKLIHALRNEAAVAGDMMQVELCDIALSAPEGEDMRVDSAINKCLDIIAEAQASRTYGDR